MGFDYAKLHQRTLYAPADVQGSNVKKGMFMACNSEDDEKRAKEQGYTSAGYIRSNWPRTMYHKTTGKSQVVGRLEWDDAKNAAAIASLGPDWQEDHVPEPEPVAPSVTAPDSGGAMSGSLLAGLGEIMAEVKAMKQSQDDSFVEMANRLAELEERVQAVESAPPPPPTIEESPSAPAAGDEVGGKKKK